MLYGAELLGVDNGIAHVTHETRDGKSWFCQRIVGFCLRCLRLRPVRDEMLVENNKINRMRPVGMQCW
jgi:hypothetical protein